MSRPTLRVAFLLHLCALVAFAQSPSPLPREVPVRLQFVDAQLSDVVKFYQTLTKRKVWLDAGLRFDRKMSVVSDGIVPRAEGIRLIREALQKEGVQIREIGDSEAYVSRAAP